MLKLRIPNYLPSTIIFVRGSAKLAFFNKDGSLCVKGIPKMGIYVCLESDVDYYLTDSKVKFLREAIDEYNSNGGESIS